MDIKIVRIDLDNISDHTLNTYLSLNITQQIEVMNRMKEGTAVYDAVQIVVMADQLNKRKKAV